jgi:predicted nuclease of predicted toxin-antitoxin system
VKFIVDAQLPPALSRWLTAAGHDAKHVYDLQQLSMPDLWIWQYAVDTHAVILTKDEDFSERLLREKKGPIIVWLRIGNCSRRALLQWFNPLFPDILDQINQGHNLIEVR